MENNQDQKPNKIQQILEKIKKNEITPHSKFYFKLRMTSVIIVAVAVFLITALLLSFIIFSMKIGGQFALIGFGHHGWEVFLVTFPWILFFLDLILMILLGWLLRTFRFGYKSPALYLLAGLLGLTILSAVVFEGETSFHNRLFLEAEKDNLPSPFEELYEHVHRPPPSGHGIFRGMIASISDGTLVVNIESPDSTSTMPFKVIISPSQNTDAYQVGQLIFIDGVIINDQIQAEGIREAPEVPGE